MKILPVINITDLIGYAFFFLLALVVGIGILGIWLHDKLTKKKKSKRASP